MREVSATRVRVMHVLVTGAAGSIGRVLCAGLTARGHVVSGLDIAPAPSDFAGTWHQGDCLDPDIAAAAVSGSVEAVVHCAGLPGEASLPESLSGHVVSTGVLLDAMVAHGATRMVYAGSNHAVGRQERTDLLSTELASRPDTFYGVAKVAAEALLKLYVDRYDLDAISCRIGSFLPKPVSTRGLSTWLSHDDCVRMIDAALTTDAPGFAVLYGISNNSRAWWDLEPGRRLGYHPEDDAEVYAHEVPASPSDLAEGDFVGGPYALPAMYRPVL